MDILKPILVVVFFTIVSVLLLVARRLMNDYRKRLADNPPYRKINSILAMHAEVVSQSSYKQELRETVAENYSFILRLLLRGPTTDLRTPVPKIDLVNHPILRDEILPFLSKQVYHDLEPMDKTLMRLIEYYNTEMEDIMSISQLLVMVIQTTPPSMYGYKNEVTELIYHT